MHRVPLIALIAVIALVAVAGCTRSAARDEPRPNAAAYEPLAAAAKSSATDSGAMPVDPTAESDRPMIIRTGEATIQVDSLDRAITRVRDLARTNGGYIANTSSATGDNNVRSASLQLKLPVDRFDGALSGLSPIGRVETVTVTAQDVGEEYVDVESRVANSRRLEERLIALLATRTGKLKDVLDVERELARVRGDIEHAEGRMRYLRAHAALSTLDVTIHEPPPLLADQPGEHPLHDAFRLAWRNFIAFTANTIAAMGIVLPLAAVGLALWYGWQRARRARSVPHPHSENPHT
jgi:Domain of unknown function (DUF4349)